MDYRIEHDSMGEVKVPADKYWGAQTERSHENFPIGVGLETMPREITRAFGVLKLAAARANHALKPEKMTDEKLAAVLSSEEEIDQRIYKFPTSHIKVKNRKSSYFEVISSLQFEACNDALKRIVPRIDFNQINTLIDEAERISEVRKRFYKVMQQQRYEKILMYAYRQL